MTFDIDQAVQEWRRKLQKYKGMEPGFVEELASSLYDRYEEYLIRGESEEQAFEKAKKAVMPNPRTASLEFEKASSYGNLYTVSMSGFIFLLPNYFKVATRNLMRKRFYNLINFVCLAVGIGCAALAVMYINYETSYDKFIPEVDRKYRLGQSFRSQDYSVFSFNGYWGAEPEVQMKQNNGFKNVKGVEDACQFYTFGTANFVTIDNKKLPTEDLLHTNTAMAFIDFFDWSFIIGSKEDFSNNLNTAILTEVQAERFYGSDWKEKDILDQTLITGDNLYTIKGVIENIPPNCHFTFSIALHKDKIEYWGSRSYIKIAKDEDPEVVRTRINESMPSINTRLAESDLFNGVVFQNVASIHLNSDILYELKPPGDKRYLYIIGIISGIILLLTISNYTNLSIALNSGRTREIGMRKIFGASDTQISNQFLMESILLSVLTLPVVALGLWVLIPYFNEFMGTELEENVVQSSWFWFILLAVGVGVGLLASVYPAIFLAKHRIVNLFRGNLMKNSSSSGLSIRKAIITFQFMLLIGLCSLTLFVNQQLRYIQESDLGFDQEQVLYVNLSEDSLKYQAFKNELLSIPEVTGVGTGSPLGRNPFNQTTYKLDNTAEVFDDAYDISLTYSSVKLLDIETSVPEYINNPEQAPDNVVLINQTLVDKFTSTFNLTREELIGRTIIEEPEYTDEETGSVGFPFPIAGTFKDIQMFSMREKITPMFLTVYKNPGYAGWVAISYTGLAPNEIIKKSKEKFEAMGMNKTFVYTFLSQNIEELYEKERRIARLSIYFSLVAFIVAVIGLIALTAFLTRLKRKEIGIRNILGASQLDILKRFNKEYLWLILMALILASPITYLGVSRWLEGFAYRISINPTVFVLAGLITLLITVLAVSLMTLRVSQAIPVETLQEDQ